MKRGAWGERFFEERLDPAVEFRRLEPAQQQRHSANPRQIQQLAGNLLPFGDEDTGQVEVEERFEALASLLGGEGVEITDLGFAQDMKPARGESCGIAGQRQAGARDL